MLPFVTWIRTWQTLRFLHGRRCEQRLVITMDKDFGELAVHQARLQSGVLLLRLGDAPSDEKVLVVQRIFELHSEVLPDHFCVYQNGRLRVRPLPE